MSLTHIKEVKYFFLNYYLKNKNRLSGLGRKMMMIMTMMIMVTPAFIKLIPCARHLIRYFCRDYLIYTSSLHGRS